LDPFTGWPDPEFLLEFDLSACKQILSWHRFALWNCPRTFIFPGKKRTPRMHQQYFQGVAFAPKHEQSCAEGTTLGFPGPIWRRMITATHVPSVLGRSVLAMDSRIE